jgi:ketosteroid isomerase-like protein
VNPFVEIVRLRVDPASTEPFKALREAADDALIAFDGFLGSELLAGPDGTWTLLVRWASQAHVQAAQAVTLGTTGLPAIADWLAVARELVSFETVESARTFTPAAVAAADAEASNLAVARRFVEQGLGLADMAVFDQCLDPDIVVVTALSPQGPIQGLAAYKSVFAGFADAWPVSSMVVHDIFAAGNRVVVNFTAMAEFRKDYYGVKANGVVAPLIETHVYTLRDGKIVANSVGAINLPFEFTMYPALKEAVLGGLTHAS